MTVIWRRSAVSRKRVPSRGTSETCPRSLVTAVSNSKIGDRSSKRADLIKFVDCERHDAVIRVPPKARTQTRQPTHGRRRLEDSDAAKVAAIKKALAAKRGVRRIARDLETGVGTVLRIKNELACP
jgi:hypothetical protein